MIIQYEPVLIQRILISFEAILKNNIYLMFMLSSFTLGNILSVTDSGACGGTVLDQSTSENRLNMSCLVTNVCRKQSFICKGSILNVIVIWLIHPKTL